MDEITRDKKSELRWGVERRLEFIEFRLFWEGRMNRHDLMRTFGVSVNQASADLNRYRKLAPENMVYDRSARTYLRSAAFSPMFLKISADRYLDQLRLVDAGVMDKPSAWIKRFPDYAGAPSPQRIVSIETLQLVLQALRDEQALEVRYQSLSKPAPQWRWIAPHALAHDGFRYHVRAWCEQSQAFKDFLLPRIVETKGLRPRDCDPRDDRDWHEFTEIEFGPHPGLSESQQRVIGLDYGMQDGSVSLRVRKSLAYYTLKRLGLDGDHADKDPAEQQIVLLNDPGALAGDTREDS